MNLSLQLLVQRSLRNWCSHTLPMAEPQQDIVASLLLNSLVKDFSSISSSTLQSHLFSSSSSIGAGRALFCRSPSSGMLFIQQGVDPSGSGKRPTCLRELPPIILLPADTSGVMRASCFDEAQGHDFFSCRLLNMVNRTGGKQCWVRKGRENPKENSR